MASTQDNNNSTLGSTPITISNVQDAFREYFNDDSLKLVKIDNELIAAGQGFTSFILRLILTWRDEDTQRYPNLPKSVILKAPSQEAMAKLSQSFITKQGEAEKSFQDMITMGHTGECTVYELFGKMTHPPVPLASAYAYWKGDQTRPPMIILEDLGDRATVLGDGSKSLTYPQILNVVDVLASLHAWCLTTDIPWREKFATFAERLNIFETFIPVFRDRMLKTKKDDPETFGKLDEEKLMKLFTPENMIDRQNYHRRWMPDVLVHGDFWANNIMFNKLPDGGMGDEVMALIDWQISLAGGPTVDLGRVLCMNADPELSFNHMEDIAKHYYDSLKTKLGKRMPPELTLEVIINLAYEQTASNCIYLFVMQDTLQSLFIPPGSPDAELRRERLINRAKDNFMFAAKIFDITSDK